MAANIEAILFDVGGTLRNSTRRAPRESIPNIQKIGELINFGRPPEVLRSILLRRARGYRKWSEETLIELSEPELWTRWMLPDYPEEHVKSLAIRLNQLWREAQGRRMVFPDTREAILALFRRGYRLGLVSNTTSSVEIPQLLNDLQISGCFETIIMSCEVGKRKPGAAILLEAVEHMGMQPENCAYVGDRPDRDVAASRSAGFSKAIIRNQRSKIAHHFSNPSLVPDHIIHNLHDLLDLFPDRFPGRANGIKPIYDATISSMWGMKKFSHLEDFFRAAPRLGFNRIELNHMVGPESLQGIDLHRFPIGSIHEPCPAKISEEELKKQDFLISSPDEGRRCKGVESIKWSIDLAKELGVQSIVVHTGQVQADPSLEKQLIALLENGQQGTQEYDRVKSRMVAYREEHISRCFEAVEKSLHELLDYAGLLGIRLGLENRYHYFDIPSPDEMARLLDMAGKDRLGFIYDCGHARSMDLLGFYPRQVWLERFADRILGAHLHDAIGIHDHHAPGLGEIDFREIAPYLPEEAFRTVEVQPFNSFENIRNGLKILAETGCIKAL